MKKKVFIGFSPFILPLILLLSYILALPSARAMACQVPGDHASIQSAVNDFSCDTIEIGAGTFNENIAIAREIVISGSGTGMTTVNGGGANSVFDISAAIIVRLENMTIANGEDVFGGGVKIVDSTVMMDNVHILNNIANQRGGGVYNESGHVTIYNSVISSNETEGVSGGGVYQENITATLTISNTSITENMAATDGGGIFNLNGHVQVTSSTLQDNNALRWGGGFTNNNGQATIQSSQILSNTAVSRGGAINNSGTLTVSNSALNHNHAISLTVMAGEGGGIYNIGTAVIDNSSLAHNNTFFDGGGLWNNGTATLTRSTIDNNSAAEGFASGGGIFNGASGLLDISQSTISHNTVINSGGGIQNFGTFTMTNSTVSGNHANAGGGLFNLDIARIAFSTFSENGALPNGGGNIYGANETVSLSHSLIVNFDGGANCEFAGSTIVSLGYNLDSDGTCNLGSTGDQANVASPLIGPLDDNGGSSETHALLSGSPAIDAGNVSECPNVDQRGNGRPFGSTCDLGAFEYGFYIYLPTILR